MITAQILQTLFRDSYVNIKEATGSLTHEETVLFPFSGDESVHWLVGHVVVARCNFLTLLNVPSIWDWPTCKLFIPGSRPTPESGAHLSFSQMTVDLDRTQTQLTLALDQSQPADLENVVQGKSVGQTLLEYAVHEAYHAGQLTILQKVNR